MCHRPRPLRVGNPKLFLRLPLLRSSSHRHARSLRTSALDYARNFTSESRLSPRTARDGPYPTPLCFAASIHLVLLHGSCHHFLVCRNRAGPARSLTLLFGNEPFLDS